ncbi:MAG: extracellular solute-binding protein [Clostridiales bacterium]|nr:extracellular solute-binding protein [Clostridiales bacterium]
MLPAAKRTAAWILAASLLLPLAACKKKSASDDQNQRYTSGQEILETDPFFDAEIYEVKLPIDPEKTLEYTSVETCEYRGGCAIASYTISYEIPEENLNQPMEYEEGLSYYVQATGIFDEKGNFIQNISSDYTLFGIASDKENKVYILCKKFDPITWVTTTDLEVINANGERIRTIAPESLPFDPESISPTSIDLNVLDDGMFTITVSGKMTVYDKDGKKVCEVTDPGRLIDGGVITSEGKHYVVSGIFDLYGDTDIQIKEVDLKTGDLREGIPANVLKSYPTLVSGGEGIFANSPNGCFRFNMKNGEMEEVFNWNDTDVNRCLIQQVTCLPKSEDEYFAVGYENKYDQTTPRLIHLTRAEKNPHAGQKMIVLGGLNLIYEEALMMFVDQYNHDPDSKARAVIVDYAEGSDFGENLSDIERKVYLDILAGTGPDVLVCMGGSAMFRNAEILEDMNRYLDGSDGISRDDYFDNVLRAFESDGKLYFVPLNFSLVGLVANSDLVGNRDGWTYEEFEAASKEIPDQVQFLQSIKREKMLEWLIHMSMSRFVDYGKKTVDFQNDEMKRILELARKFVVEKIPDSEIADLEYIGDGIYMGESDPVTDGFMEGMIAVVEGSVSSLDYYCSIKDQLDGKVTFPGYPSQKGEGMTIIPGLTMGIVSSGKYKDLAWDLIRAYMSFQEPVNQTFSQLPVNKDAFERQCRYQIRDRNDMYDKYLKEGFTPADLKLLLPEIKESDIDELRHLIEKSTVADCYDSAIIDIICEEAAGYFAGDRTCDEVLKNIQNRTSLVVKEM